MQNPGVVPRISQGRGLQRGGAIGRHERVGSPGVLGSANTSRARVWPRYRAYRWYIVLNFSARVVPAPSLRAGLVLEESSRLRGAASHFALGSMGRRHAIFIISPYGAIDPFPLQTRRRILEPENTFSHGGGDIRTFSNFSKLAHFRRA